MINIPSTIAQFITIPIYNSIVSESCRSFDIKDSNHASKPSNKLQRLRIKRRTLHQEASFGFVQFRARSFNDSHTKA